MTEQLVRLQIARESDPCLASFHPSHVAGYAEITLAELDRCALDRQFVAFDQSAFGAKVAQLDGQRRARQLEAGGHQHIRPPRLAILRVIALVHDSNARPKR